MTCAIEEVLDTVVGTVVDTVLAAPGMMDGARFAEFLAAQRRVGLTHGPRPLCRHLRPFVLSEEAYADIAGAAAEIVAALARVSARALVDPAMADLLGLTAEERALAAIDPGYPEPLALGRLDMLMDARTRRFQFIEMNADSPAGLADQLLLDQTLMALPHIQHVQHMQGQHKNVRRRSDEGCGLPSLRTPAPHLAILRVLRQVYAGWGGRASRPAIALVDWTGADTSAELRVLADVFTAAGHPSRIVDPDELRYDGRHLRTGAQPIELVYRRVIVHELLARGGLDHPLIQAYRDGAVCVANSFRTKALNKKAAFAVLSDPAHADLFTPAQRAAIAVHIPWTRRVRPGPTAWPGGGDAGAGTVDLLELLYTRPEQFVLKPNDEYGGKGVILGWDTPPSLWRRAVAGWNASLLIAQARSHAGTIRLPTFDARAPGGIVHEQVYFDVCPFVFAGHMDGAMVRVSSGPVTNVSAGAGVSGLLVAGAPPVAEPDGLTQPEGA